MKLRFIMKCPCYCTSFVSYLLTMQELHNRNASIGLLYEHTHHLWYFARSTPKIANKKQQRTLLCS